jgi:thiosulfate/3-mercaptopyruvate sulfurtransferase
VSDNILLNSKELSRLQREGRVVVVDCRFDLNDTGKGRRLFEQGHIPGASYAHLDHDLSSPVTASTGRHPLPDTPAFAGFLSRIAWTDNHLLVAYDEGSSAFAVRLWWLMRYFGKSAAVLDGGIAAWKAAGLELETGIKPTEPAPLPALAADEGMTALTDALVHGLDGGMLIDARASERFSGDVEPLDTRAGHIPGAINRPFGSNLRLNGRFRAPDELRADFERLLGSIPAEEIVHSCGSGVTACHNLFAMELAGFHGSKLYPGSWSEWILDPDRPIETGR